MENCKICGKEKVSIFGTGLSVWCPDCESDSNNKDEWIHGDGFKMKEMPKKKIDLELDLFDEITQSIDLTDWEDL